MNPKLTIIIKALNEETNIERAITSCLRETKTIQTEIILADSLSIDKTIEIAKKYPIKIVQLKNPDDRSCGIGPELGYVESKGDFIYILDGDMELEKGFLKKAIHELENNSKLAGVAGQVKEMKIKNAVFERRKKAKKISGEQIKLEMGGLYKKKALQQIKYFSNKNLHAYEEMDLGLRLAEKGWKLKRLNIPGIKHYGYQTTSFGVFKKRWKTRYVKGSGDFLKASIGKPYFFKAVWHLRIYIWTIKWWILFIASVALINVSTLPLKIWVLLTAIFLVLFTIKKRNLKSAAFSIISWHYSATGLIWGLLSKQKNPTEKIERLVIK